MAVATASARLDTSFLRGTLLTWNLTAEGAGDSEGLHNVGSLCDNGDCSMMQLG